MLADRVAERMLKLNNGRMWMAGHMRRGDCRFFCTLDFRYDHALTLVPLVSMISSVVRLSWAMENTVEKHLERVKGRLNDGAKKIREIVKAGGHFEVADIPFVKPDTTFVGLEPPKEGDKSVLSPFLSFPYYLV